MKLDARYRRASALEIEQNRLVSRECDQSDGRGDIVGEAARALLSSSASPSQGRFPGPLTEEVSLPSAPTTNFFSESSSFFYATPSAAMIAETEPCVDASEEEYFVIEELLHLLFHRTGLPHVEDRALNMLSAFAMSSKLPLMLHGSSPPKLLARLLNDEMLYLYSLSEKDDAHNSVNYFARHSWTLSLDIWNAAVGEETCRATEQGALRQRERIAASIRSIDLINQSFCSDETGGTSTSTLYDRIAGEMCLGDATSTVLKKVFLSMSAANYTAATSTAGFDLGNSRVNGNEVADEVGRAHELQGNQKEWIQLHRGAKRSTPSGSFSASINSRRARPSIPIGESTASAPSSSSATSRASQPPVFSSSSSASSSQRKQCAACLVTMQTDLSLFFGPDGQQSLCRVCASAWRSRCQRAGLICATPDDSELILLGIAPSTKAATSSTAQAGGSTVVAGTPVPSSPKYTSGRSSPTPSEACLDDESNNAIRSLVSTAHNLVNEHAEFVCSLDGPLTSTTLLDSHSAHQNRLHSLLQIVHSYVSGHEECARRLALLGDGCVAMLVIFSSLGESSRASPLRRLALDSLVSVAPFLSLTRISAQYLLPALVEQITSGTDSRMLLSVTRLLARLSARTVQNASFLISHLDTANPLFPQLFSMLLRLPDEPHLALEGSRILLTFSVAFEQVFDPGKVKNQVIAGLVRCLTMTFATASTSRLDDNFGSLQLEEFFFNVCTVLWGVTKQQPEPPNLELHRDSFVKMIASSSPALADRSKRIILNLMK